MSEGGAGPVLAVRGLVAGYGVRQVLRGVDATFPGGSLTAVIGPNGAGKSTFLKAVLGLGEGVSGRVDWALREEGDEVVPGYRSIAYVPQREDVAWDFPVTVSEVVWMGREVRKRWWRRRNAADSAAVEEALAKVDMEGMASRLIGELSGGQQQRVFLARALAQRAQVMVLDEPFAGVDARTEELIAGELRRVASSGGTVIAVHHDMGSLRRYFDRALFLFDGRVGSEGEVREVLRSAAYRSAYSVFMEEDS
jgi:manganese/zinc/iron transport system ATP- binding protein